MCFVSAVDTETARQPPGRWHQGLRFNASCVTYMLGQGQHPQEKGKLQSKNLSLKGDKETYLYPPGLWTKKKPSMIIDNHNPATMQFGTRIYATCLGLEMRSQTHDLRWLWPGGHLGTGCNPEQILSGTGVSARGSCHSHKMLNK